MSKKVLLLIVLTRISFSVSAQENESTGGQTSEKVVQQIQGATALFKDQKMAELYGYRKFGPDMPNMGTHWLYLTSAVDRNFDLSRPSTLTYLTINGEPVLTGVAYTYPVQPGETPPDLPLDEMKWHYHSGNLEEEAFGLHPKSIDSKKEDIPNLAMLHAWVWTGNPDGMFAADNWALSFIRNGIEVPEEPVIEASKALFMLSGGVDYYLKFIELAVGDSSYDEEKVRKIMDQYVFLFDEQAGVLRKKTETTKTDQEPLKELWIDMWEEIQKVMSENTWAGIEVHLGSDNRMHHH